MIEAGGKPEGIRISDALYKSTGHFCILLLLNVVKIWYMI